MGKGIIKISSDLLLRDILLLEGYEIIGANYEYGNIQLFVESDKIKNKGNEPKEIMPYYQRVDYKLLGVEGEK